MTLRKLAAVVPVAAVLALAGPVSGANAQMPGSTIPCFPFPAFCNASGQPVPTAPYPYSYLITLFRQLGFGAPTVPGPSA